jgi:anaphase-promoting complex subunit 3
MQQEPPVLSFLPQLAQRFQSFVWSCLDSDLTKTAVFHAERYYAMDPRNHEARHLYATALLREGQIHSALTLVNLMPEVQCSGCLELQAKCCTALGRHRQAREALEATIQDPAYIPTGPFLILYDNVVVFTHVRIASTSSRPARIFPDEAALRCRSGTMALKGNLSEMASLSFRQALALNSQLWEAFEGLCALGVSILA